MTKQTFTFASLNRGAIQIGQNKANGLRAKIQQD